MDIKIESGDITEQEVGAIIVSLFEGVASPEGVTRAVDAALGGAITSLIEDGEIKGKKGEVTLIHTLGKMDSPRVLVAGLGKPDNLTLEGVSDVAAQCARRLRSIGVSNAATVAHGAGTADLSAEICAQAIAEGSIMGLYKFDKYKSSNSDSDALDVLTIVESDNSKSKELEQGLAKGILIADSVNMCRDMCNEPANFMTPTEMSEMALSVSTKASLNLEVLERQHMAELGMGALLGVAQGSEEPPKFIIMTYQGDPGNPDNNIGLLGKGITFDSGGLSIKGAAGMLTMKSDMSGGAAVISAMGAIGALKPKINVTAIIPATENMPSGTAQRPGDVVKAMNGKTIEIDNTDAEGRLVLADAMSYACSIGLGRIVDVATLTGAISVALGNQCMGAFGNDQAFTDQVIAAGNGVGERVWQLPTFEEYKDLYKSDIADMRNTGGRGAGSITGAMIIGEFNDGASWVHLDIAAMARTGATKGSQIKGATGVPVRMLVNLVMNLG